ncbi:uncharacterized protein LOC106512535, partial [Austrofundulus limnaeus]|uniref:Uncharacterized protein LOC106512535 n=1 Tax=Austrofundulus limnaeus TaxID=52670 RepID=A0A2I4AMB1_AUSLI
MKMEFSLDDFVLSPTLDKLEKCKKADLLIVANHFGVEVSYSARKADLKQTLCDQLVEKGVLSPAAAVKTAVDVALGLDVTAAEVVGASISDAGPDPVSDPHKGMTTEDLRLTLRIKEVETRKSELELQTMHLRVRALELEKRSPAPAAPMSLSTPSSVSAGFDISKHITLVPPFRESEVDSYFTAFERIAAALNWPKDFWSLLLQCKLMGKAQEVCSSLSIEQSLDYEILKKTVLQAYELVPEAYRQKFRNFDKPANQTFVEFARDKTVLFDKWCHSSKVKSLEDLRELILLEEFKKCLPERIVVYLNEQKVSSLTKAALLADEFILTHKTVFTSSTRPAYQNVPSERSKFPKVTRKSVSSSSTETRECFYCHESGHLIAVCPV